MKHTTTANGNANGTAKAIDRAVGMESGRDYLHCNAAECFATWRTDVTALLAVLDAELDIRERQAMHEPENWQHAEAMARIRIQLIRTLIEIGGLTQVDIDDLLDHSGDEL